MSPQYNRVEETEVLTVGLVPQGANQEEFFLIKSDDGGGEMDELGQQVNTAQVHADTGSDALLQAILDRLQKAEATPKEVAMKMLEAVKGMTVPPELKWVVRALESVAAGKKPEYGYPKPAGNGEEMKKMDEGEITQVEKAATPAVPPEVLSKLEILEKANADLQARLAKAEADAAAQRAERRLVEISKQVESMVALPVEVHEIAKDLAWIEKQEGGAEVLERLMGILRAVDKALAASQIFKEFGTSMPKQERSLIEEAEKLAKETGISIDEAILRVSPQLQESYLRQEE
jgi:hypothetical protein